MNLRLAYLATHYPTVSHTFIQGETTALPDYGVQVVPIALNPPVPADLLTDLDRREAERTFYVKGMARGEIVAAVLATTARHPAAVAAGAFRAIAMGGWNLALGGKCFAQFIEALLVWRHCRSNGVSAIHAHFGQAPATVAWLAARFGTATSREAWTWSVTIHGWHEFATEDTSRLPEKLVAADLVISVSEFTRSQLMRISESPRLWSKIHVVRCGIDLGAFPLRPRRPPQSPRVILVTARLSPEKGHVVLFEAVARLRLELPDIQVRLIGTGPFGAELEKAAGRLGVADLTQFAGALAPQQVAQALSEADVFCLPSFAEGLPVSLMEAMAVGVPVVTTYISGVPELVTGETGWVVPAGSVDRLHEALRAALTDPRREAIVLAAREAVVARHDRSRNLAELADLFERYHGNRR